MDQKLVEMFGVLSLVLIALGYLAVRSWRARAIAHAKALPELPAAIEGSDSDIKAEASYVVTTFAELPLERVMAHGLGNRGKAQLRLSASGLSIHRIGEEALHLASSSIESVGTATATLDRVVEREGLVVITWSSGANRFDTFLRILNHDFREALLNAFAPRQNPQKVG